jgi:hypothetical protein
MIVRSLQDRISFIINIYQHNKFIQSVISTPKKCKIYTSSWNSFGINLGGWAGDYNIQITNFCCITTCNEFNRVHLRFSLYTNCQNRPCGKKFNNTAFVNLHIYNVYVNIILWRKFKYRFHEVISTEWLTSLSTSIKFKYCIIKWISYYSTDAPGQRPQVSVAHWAPAVMSVPQKA